MHRKHKVNAIFLTVDFSKKKNYCISKCTVTFILLYKINTNSTVPTRTPQYSPRDLPDHMLKLPPRKPVRKSCYMIFRMPKFRSPTKNMYSRLVWKSILLKHIRSNCFGQWTYTIISMHMANNTTFCFCDFWQNNRVSPISTKNNSTLLIKKTYDHPFGTSWQHQKYVNAVYNFVSQTEGIMTFRHIRNACRLISPQSEGVIRFRHEINACRLISNKDDFAENLWQTVKSVFYNSSSSTLPCIVISSVVLTLF